MSSLRVLVACEFSAIVRDAFLAKGHDAWSCDLLPSEGRQANHLQGDARWALEGILHKYDARDVWGKQPLYKKWDLLIAHPPCTRLCNSGVRWLIEPPAGRTLAEMWTDLEEAAALFSTFWNAPIEHVAVENPVMHRHAKERIAGYAEPAQSVQPWQFGHGEVKRTCLWLRNLPPLKPTNIVSGRTPRVHHASPGADRWKERSRFFPGIAEAMVDQWVAFIRG